MEYVHLRRWLFVLVCCFGLSLSSANAQLDQGAITGVVTDSAGALVPDASVTVLNTDTGLTLEGKSSGRGIFTFSPLKIGHYKVTVSAKGFQTTAQENLSLDAQQRLNVPVTLRPGGASDTVTVSTAPPLLQTGSGSVGVVMSTETINNTPLNGRNWVYIAQLAPGVAPASGGSSRGGGTGDFFANGQRATQNNFVLDGVDNNVNIDDFMNGQSFNMRPPPDALAEFSVATSNYSAEFGHSAGAVVNASIKSGSNQIHGDLWEYVRNTALDAKDWNATSVPPYHQNQFGATLGFPLWKNKLFYFGDVEANRIVFGNTSTLTVPTALMKQGNFTELFNPSLTGMTGPVTVYQPNTAGALPLTCGTPTAGQATTNILCPSQMSPVALRLLSYFPAPNTNNGLTYNNYKVTLNDTNNTFQWDQRLDYNFSARDQAYARFSYNHQIGYNPPPLGPVLDGGSDLGGFQGTYDTNLGESLMASETHIFNPNLTNEVRFGYNWGDFGFLQQNSQTNIAAQIGLGGIPFGNTAEPNGGLPLFTMNNTSSFGSRADLPSIERQNVYQILDNVTKILGSHSLKFGVQLESIRTSISQPYVPRGRYHYDGSYTGDPTNANTGWDIADLLTNNMSNAELSPDSNVGYYRWYRSAYAQDDWRVTPKLTLNIGLRYDYFQPIQNKSGQIANLVLSSPLNAIANGSGTYRISSTSQGTPLPAAFRQLLASQNIGVQYVDSKSLTNVQKDNFAPRFGFAYQMTPVSVIRGGYGMFFGGIESPGAAELTVNFPWSYNSLVYNSSDCNVPALGGCPSNSTANPGTVATLPYPVTLESGFSSYLSNGLSNFFSAPSFNSSDVNIKTPYTQSYNLTTEIQLAHDLVASVGYVGNVAKHLYTGINTNSSSALLNPDVSGSNTQPFTGLGIFNDSVYQGTSMYNSLQTKLEKRYSNGASFLAAYTWAHAGDNSTTPGGIEAGITPRNTSIIPIRDEFTNSSVDVRSRFTFNGFYELPFGKNKRFLNKGGIVSPIVGGWAASLTFVAQTGTPFTVSPDISIASGANSANAIRVGSPFAAGGSPDATNPYASGSSCPTSVRNRTHWYNPCAFANPLPGGNIPMSGPGSQITDTATAIAYLGGRSNQIYGPGSERVNMSLFKNFLTWRQQYLQVRADVFNLLNHPSFGNPSTTDNSPSGGSITGPQSFQNFTPDARFFQIAAKYVF
jgi:hypothetical protein